MTLIHQLDVSADSVESSLILTSRLSDEVSSGQHCVFLCEAIRKSSRSSQAPRTETLMLPCLHDGRICHLSCKCYCFYCLCFDRNRQEVWVSWRHCEDICDQDFWPGWEFQSLITCQTRRTRFLKFCLCSVSMCLSEPHSSSKQVIQMKTSKFWPNIFDFILSGRI